MLKKKCFFLYFILTFVKRVESPSPPAWICIKTCIFNYRKIECKIGSKLRVDCIPTISTKKLNVQTYRLTNLYPDFKLTLLLFLRQQNWICLLGKLTVLQIQLYKLYSLLFKHCAHSWKVGHQLTSQTAQVRIPCWYLFITRSGQWHASGAV